MSSTKAHEQSNSFIYTLNYVVRNDNRFNLWNVVQLADSRQNGLVHVFVNVSVPNKIDVRVVVKYHVLLKFEIHFFIYNFVFTWTISGRKLGIRN